VISNVIVVVNERGKLMDKEIIVTRVHQWGNELLIPIAESIEGQLILQLTNKKSFSDREVEIVKRLGYVVRTIGETL
tara:strand:+ start:395 stop:625 length:231 start_codon:yes stop_codon:yes gene_type:complete